MVKRLLKRSPVLHFRAKLAVNNRVKMFRKRLVLGQIQKRVLETRNLDRKSDLKTTLLPNPKLTLSLPDLSRMQSRTRSFRL
jgi:hypothetical protein